MNKLVRTVDDKILAGVCGGLGRYFNIDPTMVRIGFAVLTLAGFGMTIPLYVVMALVVPTDDPIL
jgi:phage shock protein C